MRGILITGCIRSGTTWLGRVLRTARGTVYLHEPMNPGSLWNACLLLPRQNTMLTSVNGGLYRGLVHRLARLDPVFPSRWTAETEKQCRIDLKKEISEPGNSGLRREELRALWKDPLALYSAEWLVEEAKLIPVVIVRHPIQVVKSLLRLDWVKTRGGLNYLLCQPLLLERFYPDGHGDLEALQARWDDLTKLDRICVHVRQWMHAVACLREANPQWIFLDYHKLVEQPREEFTQLFVELNLEPTETTFQAVGGNAVGTHDPNMAHQKALAPIPPEDPLAPGHGIDDWAKVHQQWFADIGPRLGTAASW